VSTEDCLACRLIEDPASLPGGTIHRTAGWTVEHCIGPLGVGTLIVKPLRHCLNVAELTEQETLELGPLLRKAAGCVRHLCGADQTYVCLWSHAGWKPVHIHFVVQPAWNSDRTRYPGPGPSLQAAMFERREQPPVDEVVAFCNEARGYFQALSSS
jgi:diadenosine tetraphosphate (Ap4A) HIT family hydrolase